MDILTCYYKLLGFHILFHRHNQLWSLNNFCSRGNFDIHARESLYRGSVLSSRCITPMIFQIYFFQHQSWSLWNPEKVNWNKLSKKGNKFGNWTNSLTDLPLHVQNIFIGSTNCLGIIYKKRVFTLFYNFHNNSKS